MKLLILDLDGVIVDCKARFDLADQAKLQAEIDGLDYRTQQDIYWQTALNSKHVHLDKPIEGAAADVLALRGQHSVMAFLSSRPEHMRAATEKWLFEHDLLDSQLLFLKAPGFQFVKTTVWKEGMIQTLGAMFAADEITYVDDEINNHPLGGGVILSFSSLKAALSPEKPQAVDDPFMPEE